ncbi:MAG: ATP-binding protein, partial [Chloroflexota bacterium]
GLVNKKLESILDNVVDGIVIFDDDGQIQSVNKAAERIFKAALKDMVFRPFIGLLCNESLTEDHHTYLKSGQREVIAKRFDNTTFPADLTISSATIENTGERKIAIIRDITQRKAAQEATLEAKNVAEEANKAKSEFLANMSHEIRTPLNAIIGLASLMRDSSLSAEQQDFIDTIRSSGDSLLTIINDILDFSKIEAGQLELESEPFAPRSVIEDTIDLLGAKAAGKGLNLLSYVQPEVPHRVLGDITRVRQILVNLVSNAVKFTHSGFVKITLQYRKTGSSNLVEFLVQDTGIGIPEDRIDRLFQSFSQVDASTTRKFGGTGLGLAISKQLAELMGGNIWVESKEGKGTTFGFTIQADVVIDDILPNQRAFETENPLFIAVIDPSEESSKIICSYLSSWGIKPIPLKNLDSLVDYPDLSTVILDHDSLQLPLSQAKSQLNNLKLVRIVPYGFRRSKNRSVEGEQIVRRPLKASSLYNSLNQLISEQPGSPTESAIEDFVDTHTTQQSMRILLVEDNVINQKVALNMLKRLGYEANVAGNGLEALESLKLSPYDLVLMDIQMPEMDGVKATELIRQNWPASQQPWIIAMTANALVGDKERYISAGMDAYISKPVRLAELKDALEAIPILAGQPSL